MCIKSGAEIVMVGTDKPATPGQHCFEFGYKLEMFYNSTAVGIVYNLSVTSVHTQHMTYVPAGLWLLVCVMAQQHWK